MISACLIAAFWVPLPTAVAPPVAPAPHLALDELVNEYKRLGLPLPPPNAELVRVKSTNRPDELGFRIPPKPGWYPDIMVGAGIRYSPGTETVAVVPEPAALRDVEPLWVSDFLCLAVQCRERGWNAFAALLFARAQEAITTPVPARTQVVDWGPRFGGKHPSGRLNGWALREADGSALAEIGYVAWEHWSAQVMAHDSDRKEVLRHLKELGSESEDVRDLERTLAPRASKPGTAAALVDDLTDYWYSGAAAFEPPGADARGEVAYRKLVEMGFDAVPALLDAITDRRLTRQFHSEWRGLTAFGFNYVTVKTRVGHVAGKILNDLSGHEFSNDFDGPELDERKARAWWAEVQKEGEEKWLVARAEAANEGATVERGNGSWTRRPGNRVVFRALGAKYPNRLGAVYRIVLRKRPETGTSALADEVAASKLPRAEKLALLTEGAEHNQLAHRNAALTVLAGFDPPLFRKHLLATLKEPPPGIKEPSPWRSEQAELASFVLRVDDPVYWDALAEFARRSPPKVRVEIIGALRLWGAPDPNDPVRRQGPRLLLQFLTDESADGPPGVNERDIERGSFHYRAPPRRVQDEAAEVLAGHWGFTLKQDQNRGPLSRLVIRAAVTKAAAEELARPKK